MRSIWPPPRTICSQDSGLRQPVPAVIPAHAGIQRVSRRPYCLKRAEKGPQMTPERAHSVQNQCSSAPILVHECPPFGPLLLAIGWQHTGLPQTSEPSFARPWESSERRGGGRMSPRRARRARRLNSETLSHRDMVGLRAPRHPQSSPSFPFLLALHELRGQLILGIARRQ